MPWLGLAGTLAWNYRRHRRGRSTLCSVTRGHLSPAAFIAGWGALTYVMVRHILDGYPD